MKRIYWRPQKVSRAALVFLAVFSLGAFGAVEHYRSKIRQPYYAEKIKAARMAREAMNYIKKYREDLRNRKPISLEWDPAGTGMIGEPMTEVTSNPGVLASKRTSANPNFAAAIVQMLKRAEVKKGDLVAVGFSGSFPALNICTLAAIETLELKPVIISSATASHWGANIPGLLWIDMERMLKGAGMFKNRSVAASLGGAEDKAKGLTDEGKRILEESINANGLRYIRSESYMDGLEQRMAIYDEAAGSDRYAAYINVGGGSISVGTTLGKKMFSPGLNKRPPYSDGKEIDSVMMRFAKTSVPVIHLSNMPKLAAKFGLPFEPKTMPRVGEGSVFFRIEHNRVLAGVMLAMIGLLLFVMMRSDLLSRLILRRSSGHHAAHPQQMV